MSKDNNLFDDAATTATPVMAQYLAMKKEHGHALLLFHMGDFYELFFEDAVRAAAVLNIALTKRGRYQGQDIPMCGVPLHAGEAYIAKLVAGGFKVVIAEQMETADEARQRGHKGPMKREVRRIITAGTITEEALLEAKRHNHLAAIGYAAGRYAISWMDLSTGAFLVETFPKASFAEIEFTLDASLARIQPTELLMPTSWMEMPQWHKVLTNWKEQVTPLADVRFEKKQASRRLMRLLNVSHLDAVDYFDDSAVCAAGVIASYVEETLCGQLPQLRSLCHYDPEERMVVDGITMRHLELFQTASGKREGSLLSSIDYSITAAGGRMLASMIASPLRKRDKIEERLQRVDWFLGQQEALNHVRQLFKQCPDIERALSRLGLRRGSPTDLALIRNGLKVRSQLADFLLKMQISDSVRIALPHQASLDDVCTLLSIALVDEPPLQAREGGFIHRGYNSTLDDAAEQYSEILRKIKMLEARYSQETGVAGLRIRDNALIGYFIEVKLSSATNLKENAIFRHRQSLAQNVRFVTDELLALQREVEDCTERRKIIEAELFEELRMLTIEAADGIMAAAMGMALIDVATATATYAQLHRACRPQLDDSKDLIIIGGRHGVVEQMPLEEGGFVPNDCHLHDSDRLWLLTGPNMAGKSTFLRQNALIIVMAQAGFYVPAQSALIGIIDRVCSRVGASDDIIRGRSTFMVEMIETAAILNQATNRSFVILDEIGRGTATYDGLAIAWAVVEHLHDINGARAIIATHYHELTQCTDRLPSLSLHRMAIKEWEGKIILMRVVEKGAATASYGIHAAEHAGLPPPVIKRAFELMEQWEKETPTTTLHPSSPEPQKAVTTTTTNAEKPAIDELKKINPDALTPREALDCLYRLKSLLARHE